MSCCSEDTSCYTSLRKAILHNIKVRTLHVVDRIRIGTDFVTPVWELMMLTSPD